MNLKTWCLQIWGVNTLSCLQYKNIIVDKNQSIPYFHKKNSQIFDATKLWKHTIPLTYNTKTLISNISETHRFSPQMRLIAYPDHKTTLNELMSKNLIVECTSKLCIVNPLSVSEQTSGKLRLILDLRYVNQFLWKQRVKFEDWTTALEYFN